jgi:zinc D-Ala-D-Ala carboxypeptidase
MDRAVSKNFFFREFECRCDPPCKIVFEVDSKLVKILQGIRDVVGEPISVSSGARCLERNKATPGSATRSWHIPRDNVLYAADIQMMDPTNRNLKTALMLFALADKNGATGLGLYHNRVHIDTRRVGIMKGQDRARWIDKSVDFTEMHKH